MIHKVLTFEMPPEFGGRTAESADHYFKAKLQTLPFLKREVVEPVEGTVKEATGWSDGNIPSKVQEDEITVGKTVFQVTTTPTTKRPSYKEVLEHTLQFLDTLKQQYADGVARKGVTTRNDQPFVGLGYLLEGINRYKSQVLREGVSQSLEVPLLTPESRISVPIMDYSTLPRQAGELYQHARPFHDQANKRAVKAMEAALKEHTGFSPINVPAEAQHTWEQLGNYLFHIISSPTENVKYGAIVNALIKDTKKRGKTTGELVCMQNGWALPAGANYDTYAHAGVTYVSLASLEGRIGELTQNNTTTDVRHTPSNYPITWGEK